jgi:hypothetical protein
MLKPPLAVAPLPQATAPIPLADAPAPPPAVLAQMNCAAARSCEATAKAPIATPTARAALAKSCPNSCANSYPHIGPRRLSGRKEQTATVEKWANFS